jgi:signal transduction histidine kinase
LWKLTTAAAIPYYTGQYGKSPQGFGFVTIGANVDDFHKAAADTANRINTLVEEKDASLTIQRGELLDHIAKSLTSTGIGLWSSTLLMVGIVIGIAVWMSGLLTRRITAIISGIHAFQEGDRKRRLDVSSSDEMGELSRSFNRMADSVEESFKRLEEAKEKAEEASRQKSAFLATMSHELRTPLNGILGFAELLKLELENPEQQGYVEIIEQSGGHLLNLVNEILDLAKIESGEMRFNRVVIPLANVVTESAAGYRVTAEAKGLQFELHLAENLPAEFTSDPTRLRQILNNLLSNAVKFTDTGKISFSVSLIENEIAFAVRDTGPGIPPESRETIFEKFKQLENFLTREHGGTGLGLALVRQLAEHMGGKVTLDSEVGVGSTFTVYLPLDIGHDGTT